MSPSAIDVPGGLGLRSTDFAEILSSPLRKRGKHFSLHGRASAAPRLGMVVSRKLAGSAVRRNLVKRHARAIFRDELGVSATGCLDVVVRLTANVRSLGRAAQFEEMQRLFGELLAKSAGAAR